MNDQPTYVKKRDPFNYEYNFFGYDINPEMNI